MIDAVTRTHCKRCRLEKCLSIGMRPEKVDRVGGKRGYVVATSVETADVLREGEEVNDVRDVDVVLLEAMSSDWEGNSGYALSSESPSIDRATETTGRKRELQETNKLDCENNSDNDDVSEFPTKDGTPLKNRQSKKRRKSVCPNSPMTKYETKSGPAKPLIRECGVCGSPASVVLHYGAVCCYSCR